MGGGASAALRDGTQHPDGGHRHHASAHQQRDCQVPVQAWKTSAIRNLQTPFESERHSGFGAQHSGAQDPRRLGNRGMHEAVPNPWIIMHGILSRNTRRCEEFVLVN